MKRSALLYVLYALAWLVPMGVASAVTVEVAHVGAPSGSSAVVPVSLSGAGGASIVAVEVTLQPREATLTDERIETVSNAIVSAVEKAVGGTLR